jgi:hypothetical protein
VWDVDLASVCHIGRSNIRISYHGKRKLQTAEEDNHVGLRREVKVTLALLSDAPYTASKDGMISLSN